MKKYKRVLKRSMTALIAVAVALLACSCSEKTESSSSSAVSNAWTSSRPASSSQESVQQQGSAASKTPEASSSPEYVEPEIKVYPIFLNETVLTRYEWFEDAPELLVLGKQVNPVNLGTRNSFADVAATVTELLGVDYDTPGQSFAKDITH